MQRYTITNKDLETTIKEYSLFDNTFNSATDEGNGYLEFYLKYPHNFIEGETINVNFKDINLANDIPISLRRKVMIGLAIGNTTAQPIKYFWCYEDDISMWYEIPISGVLTGYLDTIEDYIDNSKISDDTTTWEKTFRTVEIDINGNKIKEKRSNTWQELTSNKISLDCGIASGMSIAYTCVLLDTYFRIPYIDLKTDVNVIKSGWDDENKEFTVTTDYGYDYSKSEWFDKLKDDVENEYELCMNVSYTTPFYIQQSNNILPFINNNTNNLFSYHEETVKNEINKIIYCGLSITLKESCFDNEIEYDFILNYHDNNHGIQRIELNCTGENYVDGSYDLKFEPVGAAQGYYTVKDGMVMDVVLISGGSYVNITPKVDLTSTTGAGAMASAILFKDDFINITDMFLRYKKEYLTFYKTISNYSINVSIGQDFTLDSIRTELVNTKFIEVETEKAINKILDNERIRFQPVFRTTQNFNTSTGQPIIINRYYPINWISYQFHFNDKNKLPEKEHDIEITKLIDLGFNDNDVQYKKKRLSRTFCRHSFYNGFNPTQHKLECFNSVFINIDMLYSTYILNIASVSGNEINSIPMLSDKMTTEFNIFNPLLEKFVNIYKDTSTATTKETPVEYIQTSSSEGYYLYLFGEEYKQLKPQKLYMKTEFNNALSGKRTLFFNRGHSKVPLNNIFFEQNGERQYMYTEIEVCGVKVKWDNVRKVYREARETDNTFEVKYFWYPVLSNYPRINEINNRGTVMNTPFQDTKYENIEWGNKLVNKGDGKTYIEDPNKLIIKFYEANVL